MGVFWVYALLVLNLIMSSSLIIILDNVFPPHDLSFVPDAEPGISTDCPSISSWHEFSETISEAINGSLYKHFLYGPRVYFGCFLNLSGIDVKLIPWVTLWYWCHGLTTYLLYVSPLFGNRKLILNNDWHLPYFHTWNSVYFFLSHFSP